MVKRALFPGTFDPFTFGHLEIVVRASSVFDEVVIGVLNNPDKQALFTPKERQKLIQDQIQHLENIHVMIAENDLTINAARNIDAGFILRGIRNPADFTYEKDMMAMNQVLAADIEMIYLFSSPNLAHISSSLVKNVARFNGDLTTLVSSETINALKAKKGRDL